MFLSIYQYCGLACFSYVFFSFKSLITSAKINFNRMQSTSSATGSKMFKLESSDGESFLVSEKLLLQSEVCTNLMEMTSKFPLEKS